jgi:tripartite-type tricarboxylate transporter receptor subunit TctC
VSTLSEAGFAGLEIHGWIGLLAPARTPDEVCAKLNAAINAAVVRPHADQRLRGLGYEPITMTLADAPAFLRNSIDTWGRMIRATGIAAN